MLHATSVARDAVSQTYMTVALCHLWRCGSVQIRPVFRGHSEIDCAEPPGKGNWKEASRTNTPPPFFPVSQAFSNFALVPLLSWYHWGGGVPFKKQDRWQARTTGRAKPPRSPTPANRPPQMHVFLHAEKTKKGLNSKEKACNK